MPQVPHSICVLYVDDDVGFVDMAVEFLERADDRLTVETATSASDGMDLLDAMHVDCIVSDYNMPGRDGLDFLDAVRTTYPDLPFILFTGQGSEDLASEAISRGVTDYFQKQTDAEQYELLATRIIAAVSHHHARTNYQEIFENVPDGILIQDPDDGSFIDMNTEYCEMFGYESRDAFRDAGFEAIHPQEGDYTLEQARERIADTVAAGSQTFEWRAVTRDGERFWAEVNLTVTRLHGRERILAVVRDISERKQRTRAIRGLHETTQEFLAADTREEVARMTADAAASILGHPQNAVRLLDDDGEILKPTAVTSDARAALGERPRYPVGEGVVGDVFASGEPTIYDDLSTVEDGYDRGGAGSGLYVPIGDRGILSIVDPAKGAFDAEDRQLASILTIQTEAALVRVSRERALERYETHLDQAASIIGHDLTNVLTVAEGHLGEARAACESPHLESVASALDRSQALIDDLVMLIREGTRLTEVEAVDLGEAVERCWRTIPTEAATLVIDAGCTIRADQSQLEELLENLFRNAITHGGRDVTITVGQLPERAGFYVADDGPGIPPPEREMVFEAGYSTTVDGTGLGLTIVKEICDAHGWEVCVRPSETGGTRFEFTGVEVS